jgi:serine/threonine protein kinase/WD40 repeat protein
MGAKPAPSANLLALPDGTELVGDYRIARVLGAGGFGITYLASEKALDRLVTIKEYFPADFAARQKTSAVPRSRDASADYRWGLDRFIEEAQALARFDHPNIVRVHRYFRANNTGYMVLHFEDGGSLRSWLEGLGRPPRQDELDRLIAPLLDALEIVHAADFLHRDIAPDNIMLRRDGSPVLIDFGSARGVIAGHSRTVSALVKPGYSPYEQYATSGASQGPWTDIYALGATLYHAVAGKRPPDAPSRVVDDEYIPAREAAVGSYRGGFLDAIDKALRIDVGERPQSIAEWRSALLASEPEKREKPEAPEPARKSVRLGLRLPRALGGPRKKEPERARGRAAGRPPAVGDTPPAEVPASLVPPPPDAPQRQGQLIDFIEALEKRNPPERAARKGRKAAKSSRREKPRPAGRAAALAAASAADPAVPAQQAGRREPAENRRRGWRWLWPSRRWRVGLFRVAAAVTVASLVVAYQEHVQRPAAPGGPAASGTAPLRRAMQLVGHEGAVLAVAAAGGDPDGWIVSAGADATLRLWSASSGALVRTIPLPEGPVTAFAVDERRALAGHAGGTVVLWDLERGEKLATMQHGTDRIVSLVFIGEGNAFAAARQDGSVALFQIGTPAATATLRDGQESSGPLLAAAPVHGLVVSGAVDGTVRLWSAEGPSMLRTWRLEAGGLGAVAISPDGARIAAGRADGSLLVWPGTSPDPQAVRRLDAHEGRVVALGFGPEGALATAGEDGSVKLWDLGGEPSVRALEERIGPVQALSFSRDGRRLYAAGLDGIVRVWALP